MLIYIECSVYFQIRTYFHLPKVTSWKDINPTLLGKHPELVKKMSDAYGGSLDNVDLYIGGMLESTDGPGELFSSIIIEQFTRLRDADRFWFENKDNKYA